MNVSFVWGRDAYRVEDIENNQELTNMMRRSN